MWELDYKESWLPENWCFWAVVLEKTLESPLDSKEIKPVHPKGNESMIFIGRTDAEVEAPMLWLPDLKSWLFGKDPDAGKDWGQEKRATENEMVGWHHWFNGHEFEQTQEDSEGQGSLACCSPWGHKESDMTEWLNNSNTLYPNSHCKMYLTGDFPLGPMKNISINKNDFHIFTVNSMPRSLSDHSDWQKGRFLRSNTVKILVSGNKSFIKSKLWSASN